MNKFGILFLMLIISLSACRDDLDTVTTTTETPVPPLLESYEVKVSPIQGSVVGFVVDESNEPIVDGMVQLGNHTLRTDQYGHFVINDMTMNKLGTLIRVQKEGYFDGSRRFYPKEDKLNRVKIQLSTKSFDHSFNSSDGGMISIGEASLVFEPASIQTSTGLDYNGTVHVAAKRLDPSSLEFIDQMPGNLMGVNSDVEDAILATYGMVMVELEGDNGESLNLSDGHTAQIKTTVPADLLATAPAEIALWSYNEEYGLWAEESTATLQNGSYIGEVSHFSIWSFNIPDTELAFISLTLEDDDGNPLANHYVSLTLPSQAITSFAYTDADGGILWYVPANEVLEMEISVVGNCETVQFDDEIGPFAPIVDHNTPPIEVAPITVPTPSEIIVHITGSLVGCNDDPISNGLIEVVFNGEVSYYYTPISDFTFMLPTCSGTDNHLSIAGIDLDSGTGIFWSYAVTGDTVDVGELVVCQ